ncbi:MAG: hydrogenase 4 subunit B [Chloroflexi bacterium]|uniref:Hydrogenase 4 subunit B n=1 Tax=Candidatus Chlorohelix allophototropha TaxID=3003348 RepID=A0A8T7M2Q1_9CHLR|nr:hydrogenase 4 subunit B [Chloroflexota bacterium]WJW65742.1 hypothetical protein OZ401_001520 [Chloroflexota bacterium L227-S17]
MIPALELVYASFSLYIIAAILALVLIRLPHQVILLGYGLATLASILGLAAAILFLLEPQPQRVVFFTIIDFTAARFEILLDPLAAFFLLIISLGGLLVSVYAIGYSQQYIEQGKNVALLVAGYNLFFPAMLAVVMANNGMMFLIAWELMSLLSYFLVSFEHEEKEVRKAGIIYIVTTHFGTAFITGAFLILFLAAGQSFSFDAFRGGVRTNLAESARNWVFLFALVGFGTKAGLMPMHFWLPRAHPVAPSPISALMSGVMIKTAIYGLVRVSFDFLSGQGIALTNGGLPETLRFIPPVWWGTVLIVIGLVSSVLGILYAMVEIDLKKLLAFSSIENMGIISVGLGAALLFHSLQIPHGEELATLSLFASFFHLLNHTVFKGILFMGAGAVIHATHTRNLELMGGLIKRMKWTALFFLVGSLAISGLPPFNGFVSEWLTYQSLLGLVAYSPEIWQKTLGTLALSGLALTGALAATTFIKIFGTGFLGQPRSVPASESHEVGRSMRFGMGLGAFLAITLGLGANGVLALLKPVLEQWTGVGSTHPLSSNLYWSLQSAIPNNQTSNEGVVPFLLLLSLLLAIVSWLVIRWLLGRSRRTVDETWACGIELKPTMGYNSISFVSPLRRVFQLVLQPFREIKVTYIVEPYFVEKIEYRSGINSLLQSDVVKLIRKGFSVVTTQIKTIQNGSIRLYLSYILITLVILLIFAR